MTVRQVEHLQDMSNGRLRISDFHISCIGFICLRQVNGTFRQVIFTIHLPDRQVHSIWNFEAGEAQSPSHRNRTVVNSFSCFPGHMPFRKVKAFKMLCHPVGYHLMKQELWKSGMSLQGHRCRSVYLQPNTTLRCGSVSLPLYLHHCPLLICHHWLPHCMFLIKSDSDNDMRIMWLILWTFVHSKCHLWWA